MEDVAKKFLEYVEAIKDKDTSKLPPIELSNTQKLQLYAFYKQATEGDVVGSTPSIVNMIERAKWQAWNAIKGKSKEDAMAAYVKIIDTILGK